MLAVGEDDAGKRNLVERADGLADHCEGANRKGLRVITTALAELLAKKQKGQPIATAKKAAPSNVFNLMDALRASLKSEEKAPAKKATKKRKAG